jgi:hypothetical protein
MIDFFPFYREPNLLLKVPDALLDVADRIGA